MVSEELVAAELDVRSLRPAERHATIFRCLAALGPGEAFVLINDHDPRPLHYHLQAEFPRSFRWTYLEEGPSVWRVEIGRTENAVPGPSRDHE